MKISIIIPVLNEGAILKELISKLYTSLASLATIEEILFIDGGSTDQTKSIILNESKTSDLSIIYLASEKGRAKQLNYGAKNAKGDILYFLHADSYPPKNFDSYILQEVLKKNQAGCFRMKFDSSHWWLQLMSWFTRFNSKRCRGGDQSLFISAALFHKIGRYNESYSIYEDNELIKRLYKENQFVVIQKDIITSARKYKEIGVWRLQILFLNIHIKARLGSTPKELHQYYNDKIVI